MNHKALLKSLDSETRTELTLKSDRAGLKHLAGHLGWIFLLGSYVSVGAPFWGLAVVPLGICIIFLFTLLHETVHFTPFQSARLNSVVGHLCSIVVLVPNTHFRYFHLAHHKYTNDPMHDPELQTAKPSTIWGYIKHISGIPHWRGEIRLLLDHARGIVAADYLPIRVERVCVWQARMMLGIYTVLMVLMVSGWGWVFWCWALPMIVGQPFLRLYLMAEHGLCPPVANMFENTRTTFTHRAVRFLAWNMPYHAEHHAYPAVPFHRLPAFHALTKAQLVSTSAGYPAFHRDYLRSM